MRQRSSRESSASLPPKPLHAVLQTALGSLDVQLEEELSRYRRSRKSKPAKASNRRSRSRDAKPMDTIYVEAKGGRTQASTTGAIALSSDPSRPAPVPPPPPSKMKRNESPATSAQLAIAAGATSIPHVPDAAQAGLVPPAMDAPTQKLVNPDDINLGPDDYLESSEELLKSLDDDPEAPSDPEAGFVQSLLTPLGIGSMLLLLLSSVTLGYLIMNPASLGILSEGESRGDRSLNLGEVATSSNSTSLPSNALPGSPDLATEEFRELNLSTLSTLPTGEAIAPVPATPGAVPSPVASATPPQTAPLPDPQSTPTLPTTVVPATASMRPGGNSAPAAPSRPAARPSAPARPSPTARPSAPAPVSSNTPAQANTATPARLPAVQAQPATPPVAAAPAPASAPAASAPAAGQDDYYYVTTPYNGDRSLEQARQAVGDAYVRNIPGGGAQVQVGAFRDRAGAENLANELEQQGISAEVHQP